MGESRVHGVLQRYCECIPARLSLGGLAFLGFVMMTSVRINLSVAIVAMVRHNTSHAINTKTECLQGNETGTLQREDDEKSGNGTLVMPWLEEKDGKMGVKGEDDGLDWDEITQGLVLASFFYGYAFTQIIGGRFAEVYGTRITFGLCGLASGFFTLLSPIAARSHYGALIAVRTLMGFFQGPMWPSMHALVPKWIPPLERSRFISSVYFGSNLSMMLTMAVTGVIVDYLGWDAAFYIPGAICLIWSGCWFLLVADSPSQHPRISHREKQYIESAVKKSGISGKRPKRVPWCDLLTCLPFWAIVSVDVGNMFGLTVFFSLLPTYMKNVLGYSIKENGVLSSLPFLCRYLGAISFSTVGDWLLSAGKLKVLTCRRLSSFISMFFPALMCIATAYSGCSGTLTVVFLCLNNFANGAVVNSVLSNYMDIAPNFAGTIFGIANTACAIMMFLAPVCVAAIIQGQQTMAQWRKVFWIAVPMYLVPELFYLFFSSVSVQRWNSAEEEEEEQEEDSSETSSLKLENETNDLKQ